MHKLVIFCISVVFLTLISQQCQSHSIVKRQSSLAPSLPLSSYTFTTSQCYSGAIIGIITATSPGGQVTYSADIGSGNPYSICVSPFSGQITLLSGASGTFQFSFRAANTYGAMVVPVTVVCSGTNTVTTNNNIYNYGGCNTTPYNNGYSSAFGGIAPPNTPYAYNPYNTGISSFGYNPYNTGTYPYNTGTYPYNTGTFPYFNG
ncbi:hypothetical protein BV898_09736 [Hypsibius exemplaris]|uniref:Cadherin domain-containing protein n=1 Tax=Hypsibius exemplaris TaxID=2072580 RepID=A0A1W0WLL2_HYPEX|nr:hypothetical protein BV898_09736 [Hypsibius exemplaris]